MARKPPPMKKKNDKNDNDKRKPFGGRQAELFNHRSPKGGRNKK